MITEPKKIAVLRANVLGDFIFVLPALKALRDKFPAAEIVYLGKQWHLEYLSGRPGPVDRVIVVPPYPGVGEAEDFVYDRHQVEAFFEAMQREEFDIAFQLHGGGGNSNPFLLKLGAKRTVGLKTPEAPALDISVPYVYYFPEILRYLEVVAQVGAVTTEIAPVLSTTAKDVEEARNIIGFPENPIAVIHPGASDLRRRWPAEYFAETANFLSEKGYTVFITGDSSEAEVTERVGSRSTKNNTYNLCGKLSINGLTGLLSLSSLLVSNDTGPLHLARALKTPTVGIYWCSNALTGLPMNTFYNRPLVSFTFNCPLCGLSYELLKKEGPGGCRHQTSFVASISVEAVISQIKELLEQGLPGRQNSVQNSSEAA